MKEMILVKTATQRVSEDVCEVLRAVEWTDEGCRLTGQLSRPLYAATNKVLENFGGKWDRKLKQHRFESIEDARQAAWAQPASPNP